jgi:hypothetical protein
MMIHDVNACENAGSPALRVAPDKAYQKMLHESSAGGDKGIHGQEYTIIDINIKGTV